jgi:bis(5'-nucleosidyl)-tetraphosphatase
VARRSFDPNEISAGGVVVRSAGGGHEFCLVSDGRYWGIPKGNVEPGETPDRAALREIAEETGINREALAIRAELAPSEYVYRRRDSGRLIFKRVHQYLVTAPSDASLTPQESEIAEAAWLPLDEAIARASFKDTKQALQQARALLAEHMDHGGTAPPPH